MPDLFIIAGPNGAGKTTASYTILPEMLGITQFVNADDIAKGLSPFNPGSVAIQAGRIMLTRIKNLIQMNSDFAFETTLSAKSYVQLIREAQNANYYTTLVFFYLDSPELAIERVRTRVLEGGHSIPEEIVRRRYAIGIYNFNHLFFNMVDKWMVFDNSNNPLTFVAEGLKGKQALIYDQIIWNNIKQ
ncbi:MAG: zeta toxin family protein [Saprospiraceae bacterium]